MSEQEGPQYIGTRKPFVVMPRSDWEALKKPPQPLGQWVLENLNLDLELDIPDRAESEREIPFQ